jgi:DNA repair protein RecN (Recombination protein N)
MIETLSISNYALIDNIELRFMPGFNIITGETGAGKSIMLGALSMLFGNRADTKVVRDKSKKSIVEASFDVSRYPSLRLLVAEADVDWDDSQLILRREITPSGRSRSFVNDSPVALSLLRQIAMQLVDIHSQHNNLLLSTPEYQLHIIDTLLPDKSLIEVYHEAYDEYCAAIKKYRVARRAADSGKAEEEYLRFQLEKLQELNLVEGEQDELENERNLLSNVTDIKQTLAQLINLFNDPDRNIISDLNQASTLLSAVSSLPDAEQLVERLDSIHIDLQDIASTIDDIDSHLDVDPQRLQYVEERLSDIYNLQRKHSVDTVEQLITIRDSIAARLDAIDNSDDRIKALAVAAKRAKNRALECAAALSEQRRKVAADFARDLYQCAEPLGMKNLQVDIHFDTVDLNPDGTDAVVYLFSFNKNQPMMPVKDTASGGEVSRLMLSIKAIVADKIQLPSIIFDEIDTGVSGDVANRMGDLMKRISANIQVIAITHLPQVAAKGDTHFKVYKQDSDTATNTHVARLDPQQRIGELALMLSGDPDNQAARNAATSLLQTH